MLNLINQDPVQPKGIVLLNKLDSSVLEIPFLYKDSKLSTANSLIYTMTHEIEELQRNNWKKELVDDNNRSNLC